MPNHLDIFRLSVFGALHQGTVLSGIKQYVRILEDRDSVTNLREIVHSFCVVLSQECDLEWDYEARNRQDNETSRLLKNVLCCSAAEETEVRAAPGINAGIFKRIKQNKDERYHYLEECPNNLDANGTGVSVLVIDFKRYFSIPTTDIYHQLRHGADRRCELVSPYVEHLSQRFSFFQARIALPRNHGSDVI